jgi:DNA (cytosine-5)-methyltransferase 1
VILSTFSGAGGMDVAAHALGQTTHGIEVVPEFAAIAKAAGHSVSVRDVRTVHGAEATLFDGLMGGPPCQTLSAAGTGAGRQVLHELLGLAQYGSAADLRAWAETHDASYGLALEPLRLALATHAWGRPFRWVALEQVPPVLPLWQAVAERLRLLGYSAVSGTLKAEEYGVPQTRRRAVMIASLDREVRLPTPTHRAYMRGVPQADGNPFLAPWVSIADVLELADTVALRSNYRTGGLMHTPGVRLVTQPASTITGKCSRVRWLRDRHVPLSVAKSDAPRLTPAQAACLQSFPDNHPWDAAKRLGDQYQAIGNACPPAMWMAVLREVLP